jgi:hypothetical protein
MKKDTDYLDGFIFFICFVLIFSMPPTVMALCGTKYEEYMSNFVCGWFLTVLGLIFYGSSRKPKNDKQEEVDVTLITEGKCVDRAGHCPVCARAFEVEPTICPQCETPHHTDCWNYSKGCAIYGCNDRLPIIAVYDYNGHLPVTSVNGCNDLKTKKASIKRRVVTNSVSSLVTPSKKDHGF